MMHARLRIGLDPHRSGPDLLGTDAGMVDRGLAEHAGRLGRVGVELVALDDANAIMLPARFRGSCSIMPSRSCDQFHTVDVDHAAVADLEVRDDGQRQEGHLEEGFGQGHAEAPGRVAQRQKRRVHILVDRSLISPATGKGRSASTRPPSTTAKPPRIVARWLAASAMSASSAPTTQMLWLSWPIEDAMAPRLMPKPFTKPRPILPFRPCRSTTQTLATSCEASVPTVPPALGRSSTGAR